MPETRKPTAKLESAFELFSVGVDDLSHAVDDDRMDALHDLLGGTRPHGDDDAPQQAADVAPVERRKVALARKMPEGIGDELVILQQLGYGDGDEFIEIVKIVVKRSAIALGGAGHLANRQLEDAVVLDELPKRLDDTGACIGRIGVLTRSRHAPHRTPAPWRS